MNRLVDQLNQPLRVTAGTFLGLDSIKCPEEAWKHLRGAKSAYVVFRRVEPSGKGSLTVTHEMSILHLNGERDWGEMVCALEELGQLYDQTDERNCQRFPHGLLIDPQFA